MLGIDGVFFYYSYNLDHPEPDVDVFPFPCVCESSGSFQIWDYRSQIFAEVELRWNVRNPFFLAPFSISAVENGRVYR